MYFYHEHCHDAYAAAGDDLVCQDPRDGGRTDEPIRIPAIINWCVAVSVALLAIVAAIQALI